MMVGYKQVDVQMVHHKRISETSSPTVSLEAMMMSVLLMQGRSDMIW